MAAKDTPKRIVARFYAEIWNGGDETAIARLCDETMRFRGSLGVEKRGREEFADYVRMVRSALGEYHCEMEDLVVENDRAFARMRFSGVHRGELLGYAPTGRLSAMGGGSPLHRCRWQDPGRLGPRRCAGPRGTAQGSFLSRTTVAPHPPRSGVASSNPSTQPLLESTWRTRSF